MLNRVTAVLASTCQGVMRRSVVYLAFCIVNDRERLEFIAGVLVTTTAIHDAKQDMFVSACVGNSCVLPA
jgi:hypothetical protein